MRAPQHPYVSDEDARRQLATVVRVTGLLGARRTGFLADDVGMGKTFEAIALIATLRRIRPRARVLVVAPTPLMRSKWIREMTQFFHQNVLDPTDGLRQIRNELAEEKD